VQGGHLVLKPLTPVLAMRRGLRLHPDDPGDPRVFRVEVPEFGMNLPVALSAAPAPGMGTARLVLAGWSFQKRPEYRNPRRWVTAAAATSAVALAIRHRRHQGA